MQQKILTLEILKVCVRGGGGGGGGNLIYSEGTASYLLSPARPKSGECFLTGLTLAA